VLSAQASWQYLGVVCRYAVGKRGEDFVQARGRRCRGYRRSVSLTVLSASSSDFVVGFEIQSKSRGPTGKSTLIDLLNILPYRCILAIDRGP
jgi:hypothetical protein